MAQSSALCSFFLPAGTSSVTPHPTSPLPTPTSGLKRKNITLYTDGLLFNSCYADFDVCYYNGVTYNHGETFPAGDGCNNW